MQRQKRTGLGTVGIWSGRHVHFDDNGNYPIHSMEGLLERNTYLERRNRFLEDLVYRACLEDDDENHAFVMIQDTTWG